MKRLIPALLGCALTLAACGGSSTPKISHPASTPTLTTTTPVPVRCPPGQSFMGCASGASPSATRPPPNLAPRASTGPIFPDVSSYQGHPNWAAAKPYITGGVAKAFEYSEDPDFAYNVAQLKAQHLPWAAYDFVRSCDASGFIAVLRSVGGPSSMPPVLDEEVAAAAGCTATLEAQIWRAFHRVAVEYTSPGTEQSGAGAGSPPLWIADFGPSFPCLWTCHPVAWQYASPPYVYVYIPGVGYGDVNRDYGMTKLVPTPVKPKPSHAQIARWTRARNASRGAYVAKGCPILAQRERWFGARLHGRLTAKHRHALNASRTAYRDRGCVKFAQREVYFAGRLRGR